MEHWTKTKGDSGVGFIIADLMSKGIHVALPISEHLPFDCIAVSPKTSEVVRISCKYRKAVNGSFCVRYSSCWSDKHGVHTKPQDKSAFDFTAIYCPDSGKVYYINNNEIESKSFFLRIVPSKNSQTTGVRLASLYEDANRIFK